MEKNIMYGKDQIVGKYIGPKKPTDLKKTLHHFESFKYNIKHVEVTVRKSIPIENLKLKDSATGADVEPQDWGTNPS